MRLRLLLSVVVLLLAMTGEAFSQPKRVMLLHSFGRDFAPIKGEIPSPLAPPPGCHFHPRCPHAMERCAREVPVLREIASGRLSACHLNDQ